MEPEVQEYFMELKSTIEALEKQIKYLNKISAEEEYADELISQKLNVVTSKLVGLEQAVKQIELQVNDIEEHSPTKETSSKTSNTRLAKRRHVQEAEEESSALSWTLIVTIIVSVISFLAGPIIEIIKYLLK